MKSLFFILVPNGKNDSGSEKLVNLRFCYTFQQQIDLWNKVLFRSLVSDSSSGYADEFLMSLLLLLRS